MRSRDHRWLLIFSCNLLLLWLAGLANHALSPGNLTLYPGGLLVTFAALRLDLRHGALATALTALAADALTPAPFGLSLALYGLGYAAVFSGRQRFPREEPALAVVVALLVNLFLFLALSFVLVAQHPRPAAAWPRLFGDLLFSQGVLALVTPWFTALQARLLALARLHPESGRPVTLD